MHLVARLLGLEAAAARDHDAPRPFCLTMAWGIVSTPVVPYTRISSRQMLRWLLSKDAVTPLSKTTVAVWPVS